MREAADALDFEMAAVLRDKIKEIQDMMVPGKGTREGARTGRARSKRV